MACLQYVRYLGLEAGEGCWRRLYMQLRGLHGRARSGALSLSWEELPARELWAGDPDLAAVVTDRLVQGGHSVLFYGDLAEMRARPLCAEAWGRASAPAAAFRPAEFLDVVPVSPSEVVGVTPSLALERRELVPGGSRLLLRRASGPASGDGDGGRLFVEHVAGLLFWFVGGVVRAFELQTLELRYAVSHEQDVDEDPVASASELELFSRWDYGRTFVTYEQEGHLVSVWGTATGSSEGCLETSAALLCCDVSHATLGAAGQEDIAIVVMLQADGHIRLCAQEAPGEWWIRSVVAPGEHACTSPLYAYVEVKLERCLLLAVSHSEDGQHGAAHAWSLDARGASAHRWRCFAHAPDRVEARHGGAFVEVCFASAHPTLMGVLDVKWLDPLGPDMKVLLEVESAVADWRCDVRDCLATVREETMTFRWASLLKVDASQGSTTCWGRGLQAEIG
ncbi:unnamed protein product, partial [Prorocentrum cordatum]